MRASMLGARRAFCVAAAAALLTVGACTSLDAPDQNAISISGLTQTPTVASVTGATQDLLAGMRNDAISTISTFGQFGREGYDLDPGNLQFVQEYFVSLGDVAIWSNPYRTIELADLVLTAVDGVPAFTAEQQEGIRGFAMTAKAVELLTVIRCTGQSGAAIDVASDPRADLPPIESESDVYAYIKSLLDSAQTHLQAAGGTFAFTLGAGFAGFDTPATFLQFNRAIRARADIDTGNFDDALTDLQGSFVSTSQPLSYGPFNTYSTASGDAQNTLFEAQPRVWYAHPSLAADAQHKADGTLDDRFLTKVKEIPSITRAGITTQWTFQKYTGPSSPIPIITNEELLLLRAEANLGLGQTSDAIQDINVVRVNAGGLPPISDPYEPAAGESSTLLGELLYEKRYSLMWSVGSSSWLDARHYGLLAELPKDLPNFVVYPYTRISDVECQARDNAPAGCQTPQAY